MGPTKKLANFIAGTGFHDIPVPVVEKAKGLILNVLGSMLAGCTEKTGKIAINLVKQAGGEPHSSVVGGGFKTSELLAALANGISAHATDQDDTDWRTLAHPTVAILPAVLALGEYKHAAGIQILQSYILGVEAEGKVGWGVWPMHHEMGFHSTGSLGHVGATVGCCKVLGLKAEQIETALGIMGSLASGIRHNVGSMTKPLHAGNAAQNGVLAASLAQNGFTSVENVLENPFGFAEVFGGKNGNAERMVEDLGHPYLIESPGITIKGNPCGTYGSVLVQALQEMVKEYGFSGDSVESVHLVLNPGVHKIMHYIYPKDMLEAKYSIPFIVAVTLTDGEATLKQFTDEKTQDQQVRGLISKIKIDHHPSPPESPHPPKPSGVQISMTHITIRFKNGQQISRWVDSAKGYVNQPLTKEEILQRFSSFAGLVLPDHRIEKTVEMVSSLEKIGDTGSLMDLLR